MEELRLRTGTLELKYKDWSKVLIEPATLNEARVYSLESRMQSEEEVRIKEYEFLKDLLKKLAFSLEELSLKNLEGKKTLTTDSETNLPRLMSSSPSNGRKQKDSNV